MNWRDFSFELLFMASDIGGLPSLTRDSTSYGDTVERVNTLCALHTFIQFSDFFLSLLVFWKKMAKKTKKKLAKNIVPMMFNGPQTADSRFWGFYLWRTAVSRIFPMMPMWRRNFSSTLQFLSQIYSDNVNTHGPYALKSDGRIFHRASPSISTTTNCGNGRRNQRNKNNHNLNNSNNNNNSCSWFLFLGSSNVLSDVVSTRTTARQMLAFLHLHDFINIFFLFFSSLLFPRPNHFLFLIYEI